MLSMTTDYKVSTECPEPYLRRIAEAGFTHVHWCHHWSTDFLYAESEIGQIADWLEDYGLAVTDLHGTAGQEKAWMAFEEYRRLAGVELVENRLRMVARLGADVVIMHMPGLGGDVRQWDQTQRTLDELEPCARACGVRIAIENGCWDDIERVLDHYPPDFVGMCYDCGHGNCDGVGLDRLEAGLKDRIISIHIHDNDGEKDLHQIIGHGTVDRPRLARVIADSSYEKWLNQECTMDNTDIEDEAEYLAEAYRQGAALAEMIAQYKEGKG